MAALTCTQWKELRDKLQQYIFDGTWINKKIVVEDSSVELESLDKVMRVLSYVEAKIATCDSVTPHDTSSGLRTVAFVPGPTLQ